MLCHHPSNHTERLKLRLPSQGSNNDAAHPLTLSELIKVSCSVSACNIQAEQQRETRRGRKRWGRWRMCNSKEGGGLKHCDQCVSVLWCLSHSWWHLRCPTRCLWPSLTGTDMKGEHEWQWMDFRGVDPRHAACSMCAHSDAFTDRQKVCNNTGEANCPTSKVEKFEICIYLQYFFCDLYLLFFSLDCSSCMKMMTF